jgi:HD-GYP domain-containing protein (c-di-GMP phosphodiesterase class II)
VTEDVRLAELLAALSITTDLAMGQEPEKAVRATVVAVEIARTMLVPEEEVRDVYFATLLKHIGCTATPHEELGFFGPDAYRMRRVAERTDAARARESFELMRTVGRGAGLARPRYLARAIAAGREADATIVRAVCEVAAQMSRRLRLGDGVGRALFHNTERWDGKGGPEGLRGEDIPLPARVAEPATQAIISYRNGGEDEALAMVRRRAGGWFDPAVVEAFEAVGPVTLERLDAEDPWTLVLASEPEPARTIPPDRLDAVAEAFADVVDLATPFTMGHASGVAELAVAAAERLSLHDPRAVRRAALLHDLGRTSVGAAVWEKAGPLSTSEWEQVRLHAYHTERILSRSVALRPLARMAGMHHERRDGSGYHRGASAKEVPPEARLLGAADTYQAMTQERPHRPALEPARASEVLLSEVRAGRLDPECARAVIEAAGLRPSGTRELWPARLSDREVDVIRLLTRGLSNRAIADALVISPRTAEHHVQHIYAKIGVSTRAGAAMFAMEHGLLRD